jgi:hypothetical protein
MEKVLLSLSMISGRKKALESFYYKTLFPILLFYLILYIFANAQTSGALICLRPHSVVLDLNELSQIGSF